MPKKDANKLLFTENDWSFETLEKADEAIAELAGRYGLDTYPNQIEVISYEQMLDAYASVGMPVGYSHWSFGKSFIANEQQYKRGQMGLAYEIVINSSPCIAYLMEENTMTMQALVIAHASYGHNSFFKGNELFRQWTDASYIIEYLKYAKKYIADCEERHGTQEVESLLDACHALQNYGVDRYKYRGNDRLRLNPQIAAERMKKIREFEEQHADPVMDRTIAMLKKEQEQAAKKHATFPAEPQENILRFAEEMSPTLHAWEREVVNIVRNIAQYFYPQRQTQVMNEGWATFWHYTLLNQLFDEGRLSAKTMTEFLHSHTNVVAQPGFDSPYYSGINPYALGFAMMRDISRICCVPTEEDKHWFIDLAGCETSRNFTVTAKDNGQTLRMTADEFFNSDIPAEHVEFVHITPNEKATLKQLDFAMRNHRDTEFVGQYLSPKVMRDFKFFAVSDHEENEHLVISAIHDEPGYKQIRRFLSQQYNLANVEARIEVQAVDRVTNSLLLQHTVKASERTPLNKDTVPAMLQHVQRLWGREITLQSIVDDGELLNTWRQKLR
jgi:spore cortex formation protein SpoVR/YcgB (stage V sporulation)